VSEEVLFERHGENIAVVTINRPEQRNAINAAVRQGLFEAWERIENDPSLRVAILTGSGDQAFSAGGDLKEMAEKQIGVVPPGFLPILGDNVQLTKPVIAAVNGIAYAGGWLFAQMCDLCVASSHARFGITEAKVGRGMPWAAPLIHMIPQRLMMEILITAQPISAKRAWEIGLVNHVVEPDQLMPKALELAGHIAQNAPLTVAAAKELVALSAEMGRGAALRAAVPLFDRVYRSSDAIEGPLAFKEKRKPRWTGN
jgi:enoyl-CoA hydratase